MPAAEREPDRPSDTFDDMADQARERTVERVDEADPGVHDEAIMTPEEQEHGIGADRAPATADEDERGVPPDPLGTPE
jgi:hypothetical protein